MDDLSRFCCLNSRCPDFGRHDAGNLTVTGRLGQSRQYRLLYCRSCRARFSERKGTPLFRSGLPPEKPETTFTVGSDQSNDWESESPFCTDINPKKWSRK